VQWPLTKRNEWPSILQPDTHKEVLKSRFSLKIVAGLIYHTSWRDLTVVPGKSQWQEIRDLGKTGS